VETIEEQLLTHRERINAMTSTQDLEAEAARLRAAQGATQQRLRWITETIEAAQKQRQAVGDRVASEAAEVLHPNGDTASAPVLPDLEELLRERRVLAQRAELLPRALQVVGYRLQSLAADELRPLHRAQWAEWLAVYAQLVRTSLDLRKLQDLTVERAGNLLPLPVPLERYLPGPSGTPDYVASQLAERLDVRDAELDRLLREHANRTAWAPAHQR